MNTVDKLNNVLGWLTAMNFDKPELSNYLEEPLNVLSEAISEVENLAIHSFVVPKGTLLCECGEKPKDVPNDGYEYICNKCRKPFAN